MNAVNERDVDLLLRILDYCDRIESCVNRFGNDYEIYKNDWDYQDAVKMNLFQIGETTNNLTDEIKETLKNIPWHQIYGMRNIIAHGYEKVHESEVWKTITDDIPNLKKQITEFLQRMNIDTD